ncbi:MAG: DEAD/DEAH box helicase [Pseudomonadales bacterium]|nr:DEAD/DEAH box helicase [Pseudomonadales bacterium]
MPKKKQPGKPTSAPRRPAGWLTTDADEIERRRTRGLKESFRMEPSARKSGFFATYQIDSQEGQTYRVEIRSLTQAINSCDCPDHRVNGLGTCKHIEGVLSRLQQGRTRAFKQAAVEGGPWLEIYLDRRDHQVRLLSPQGSRRSSKAKALLAPFFSPDNSLAGEPLDILPAMERAVQAASPAIRRVIRVSGELNPWLEDLDRREQRRRARRHFEAEVAAGRADLHLVKQPLYPYQQEGMLHLAFTGRALLADEMGLGKTVQAIAACELLRRTLGIKRVLVISPASLKGEWEEQIGKFTGLPTHIVQGPRAKRLQQYGGDQGFFYLANYEQVRPDTAELNAILAPDVIILDEAQRIKNWQAKTAAAVKRLQSPYAFVLTGTPVENRIDEIYSIVQFLDPGIFGPLFRFNRDFYQLDEKGRAIGYKNLDRLHERLKAIMLRRRKEEVEGQLPGRTVNTYFVPMHPEQTLRYEEYEARVARLAAMARRRPLKKEEMERLQQYLACMRMLCDTPYILDPECRISPKVEELGDLLQEILADGDHKIIVFSEWARMLELVQELAGEMGIGHAVHTGSVPLPERREEIRRFKNDPACRLFLSTDSGAVGLNLQVADVVINVDMPWNPAKLEQRIARAWRKHQKRPVQVINLVSEHTIEHRMLSLLEQKRSLAEGVVDGRGEAAMRLPSGRAAFLERLDALMVTKPEAASAPAADLLESLRDSLLPQWQDDLALMELHGEGEKQTLLVVADAPDGALRSDFEQYFAEQFPGTAPRLQLLDRSAFAAIEQLIEAGILRRNATASKTLYRAPAGDGSKDEERVKRLAEARARLAGVEHKRRMAAVLAEGGFPREALTPLAEAVEGALEALLLWRGHASDPPPSAAIIDARLVKTGLLPAETPALLESLRRDHSDRDEAEAGRQLKQGNGVIERVVSILGKV